MKLFYLLIFLPFLISCNQWGRQEANRLNDELVATPILSAQFDSLIQVARGLPDENRLSVLLSVLERKESGVSEMVKQESLLLEALSLAQKKDRKKIVLCLIDFYVRASGMGKYPSAVEKGVIWCENLKNKYSLSSKEEQEVKSMKVSLLMNNGQLAASLPICYELMAEHRVTGDHSHVVDDLLALSAHYGAMGDFEQSLSFCKEAYQLALDKQLTDKRKKCAVTLINRFFDSGRYAEAIALSKQDCLDADSVLTPSFCSVLSDCYLKLNQWDSSRFYLEKSMKPTINAARKMRVYGRIAETYIAEGREDSATVFLDRAEACLLEWNSLPKPSHLKKKAILPDFFMPVYSNYALLLQKNGKQEKALQAIRQIEPQLRRETDQDLVLELQIDAMKQLASFYRNAQDFKKAADLLIYRDSLQEVWVKLKEENQIKLTERF